MSLYVHRYDCCSGVVDTLTSNALRCNVTGGPVSYLFLVFLLVIPIPFPNKSMCIQMNAWLVEKFPPKVRLTSAALVSYIDQVIWLHFLLQLCI